MSLIRISKNPSVRQLKVFAAAWLAFLALSGLAFWLRGRHTAAEALWILAFAVPLAGALSPAVVRYAYVGLSYATYPIGFVVSHVVLAIVYFLVLTPIGLAMRLFGHDPLARRFDPGKRSYWSPADRTNPVESYFKQG
jgi:ABC-type uncharacterized transport system permease subunit